MKVLIIGRGGREDAICKKIVTSPLLEKLYIAPGSTTIVDSRVTTLNIDEKEIEKLMDFAKTKKIDLTIVGPEVPLSLGIVDLFQENNLKIFGPTKEAAKIESSKEYAKILMNKYNIPTSKYQSFTNYFKALEYLKNSKLPIVIKEDGLAAGKGVTVANSREEGIAALNSAFKVSVRSSKVYDENYYYSNLIQDEINIGIENKVVIEEFLEGYEFSLIAAVNGEKIVLLPPAKDHKRAFDFDLGLNTGGMGAYSPVDFVDEQLLDRCKVEIIERIAKGLINEGTPFKGFIFAGIMVTLDGPKVIEFNARLGDPESEVILKNMKSDFLQFILDMEEKKETTLEFFRGYSLGVVLASCGYPSKSHERREIDIDENILNDIYFMGCDYQNGKYYSNGGRVLMVTTREKTLEEARKSTYEKIKKIKCQGAFYRSDIGLK